jgi:fumarylpyruvate hydrolase
VPVSQCGHLAKGRIHLKVNGQIKQDGDLAMMIWNVPDTIAYLSTLFTLMPGDLIFSGTPAGVAAVVRGDILEGHVDGLPVLKTTMV